MVNSIKKMQPGGLIRKGIKMIGKKLSGNATKAGAKKITKFSSEAEKIAFGQKPNLQKAKEAAGSLDAIRGKSYSKRGLEMAIERRTNPAAANKKMTKAQREAFALDESYKKNGGPVKKMQSGGKTPTYKNLPLGVSLEEEERSGYRKAGIKPTKQDSAAYKQGYDRGVRGEKRYSGESPIGRMGRYEGQNSNSNKMKTTKKMQNGGSLSGLKASTKRVGPVDPNGAWTKVQEKTIAGARGKAVLKKDKQLDASKIERKQAGGGKMKMGGSVKKK